MKTRSMLRLALSLIVLLLASGCRPAPDTPLLELATPTPTPTMLPILPLATTPAPSACAGVSGMLEVQMLVGPGAAGGLTPVSVGQVPFSASSSPPYTVSGNGLLDYNETLTADWGTYTVTFNMSATLSGECQEPGVLVASLTMEGSQNTAVRSQGLNQDYPWSGTVTRQLNLPLEEGATASGEGWSVVLHLQN